MSHDNIDKPSVIEKLNQILEWELAGVVRYTHYSMMVFGHARIPITSYYRGKAQESLAHAQEAGEMITLLGGHPSLKIGPLLETEKHHIDDILRESFEHERNHQSKYYELLAMVKDKDILLEEYCRKAIAEEELHIGEIDKMLRKPGQTAVATN
jgi:bacterioferritin